MVNYDKGGKNIQWDKDGFFNKWCWQNRTDTCKKNEIELTPCKNVNSKWIKDLNVKPETIKLLEENIGSKQFHIALSNISLDMSPQAKETKKK